MTDLRRPIRRLAIGSLFFVFAAVLVAFVVSRGISEGQTSSSPDGRFRIAIWRSFAPFQSDPYQITLTNTATDKIIKRLNIIPMNGYPNQELRESERAIHWNNDGTYADIVLDGDVVCRVYTK